MKLTFLKRHDIAIGFATFLILGLCVYLFWPVSYDLNRVPEKLRNLKHPYTSVKANVIMDGGSITIAIVDREGTILKLLLPASPEEEKYKTLLIGAELNNRDGAIKLTLNDDTKKMLIETLEKNRESDQGCDYALLALRNSPVDFMRAVGTRITR